MNDEPYGEGRIVRLQPSNLEQDKLQLVTGQAAVGAFRQLVEEREIPCR
jgi:glycine cleavage system H lipoate-binding protein